MHSPKSILVAQLIAGLMILSPTLSWAADSPEQKNIELVGRSDLNGNGDGGEGMAIQQWPDGRRIIYIAHEGERPASASSTRLVDVPGVANIPLRIEEVGYFVPTAPRNNPTHAIAINHAIVDEHGLIYAVDRETGGLYILKYTGQPPLD